MIIDLFAGILFVMALAHILGKFGIVMPYLVSLTALVIVFLVREGMKR